LHLVDIILHISYDTVDIETVGRHEFPPIVAAEQDTSYWCFGCYVMMVLVCVRSSQLEAGMCE